MGALGRGSRIGGAGAGRGDRRVVVELGRSGWGCAVRSGGWKGTGGCDPLPEVIQMTWMIILRVERI